MSEPNNEIRTPWYRRLTAWTKSVPTLNWTGFTRQGVSKFTGNVDVPPPWAFRFIWILAIVEGATAIAVGVSSLMSPGGFLRARAGLFWRPSFTPSSVGGCIGFAGK